MTGTPATMVLLPMRTQSSSQLSQLPTRFADEVTYNAVTFDEKLPVYQALSDGLGQRGQHQDAFDIGRNSAGISQETTDSQILKLPERQTEAR